MISEAFRYRHRNVGVNVLAVALGPAQRAFAALATPPAPSGRLAWLRELEVLAAPAGRLPAAMPELLPAQRRVAHAAFAAALATLSALMETHRHPPPPRRGPPARGGPPARPDPPVPLLDPS